MEEHKAELCIGNRKKRKVNRMPFLPGLSGPPKIEVLKATRNVAGLLNELASKEVLLPRCRRQNPGRIKEAGAVEP